MPTRSQWFADEHIKIDFALAFQFGWARPLRHLSTRKPTNNDRAEDDAKGLDLVVDVPFYRLEDMLDSSKSWQCSA